MQSQIEVCNRLHPRKLNSASRNQGCATTISGEFRACTALPPRQTPSRPRERAAASLFFITANRGLILRWQKWARTARHRLPGQLARWRCPSAGLVPLRSSYGARPARQRSGSSQRTLLAWRLRERGRCGSRRPRCVARG